MKGRAVGLRSEREREWWCGIDWLMCHCKYFGFYLEWDIKPLEGFSEKMAWSYFCLNRITLQVTLKIEWTGHKSRSREASLYNNLVKDHGSLIHISKTIFSHKKFTRRKESNKVIVVWGCKRRYTSDINSCIKDDGNVIFCKIGTLLWENILKNLEINKI